MKLPFLLSPSVQENLSVDGGAFERGDLGHLAEREGRERHLDGQASRGMRVPVQADLAGMWVVWSDWSGECWAWAGESASR